MIKVNGFTIAMSTFPNNELNLKLPVELLNQVNQLSTIVISWHYESDSEIFQLLALKKHLESNVVQKQATFNLFLPYIPYSRMDRAENGSPFTLKYFAELINTLAFERISVFEAHSDVALALLNNVIDCPITSILTKSLIHNLDEKGTLNRPLIATFENKPFELPENVFLVYPDAGAYKRYNKAFPTKNEIHAVKIRNFETGNIEHMELTRCPSKPGFTAIIMDDLVSRGWTFKFVIDALKEKGVSDVYLVVTHCENALLDGVLLKEPLLKGIITTNSLFNGKIHEKMHVLDADQLYERF